MNFNMNLKYILIGLLGMNGAAVMPQAIQQEVVEPTENALIIPMNSQNVTTLFDPQNSVSFDEERGVVGTSNNLTLDLGNIDFGNKKYDCIWVEMSYQNPVSEDTKFEFYLDDDLVAPKTSFSVPLNIAPIDYHTDRKPQSGLYFKNEQCPYEAITVFDLRNNDNTSKLIVEAAQGVINQKRGEVYLIIEDHHIRQFEDAYGIGKCNLLRDEQYNSYVKDGKTYNYSGLASFMKRYKNNFSKMVLWTKDKKWTWCMALMICAQEGAIPVTEDIMHFFQDELGVNLPVEDIRDKWSNEMEAYEWVITEFVDKGKCHPTLSFSVGLREDSESNPWRLYDYAVATKGLIFYLEAKEGSEGFNMIQKLCAHMKYPIGSSVMGYGAGDDGDGLNKATNPYNVGFMVSDFYSNGSFWCSYPRKAFQQRKGQAIEAKPGKIYVSLVWSDGDNIQFDANHLYNMFSAPGRGDVPVGVTMAASLQELNPFLLEYFYKNLTPNDELMAGSSGFQFIYGDSFATAAADPDGKYDEWLAMNNEWLATAGFHTGCLWNTSHEERYREYMRTCGLQGVYDGNNVSYRYEKGKNGEGVVSISQGAHCWKEGDVYNYLTGFKPSTQKPVFCNVYLIAANYGGLDGYERLKRELTRLEMYLPNTYEFLLPMDLCATFNKYLEEHGGKYE